MLESAGQAVKGLCGEQANGPRSHGVLHVLSSVPALAHLLVHVNAPAVRVVPLGVVNLPHGTLGGRRSGHARILHMEHTRARAP
eukprot:14539000-Alexandrium_andersonii.AAC.1